MTGQVLHFSASGHRIADELLPWLVNGTLSGDELATVSAHVRECPRCRHELEFLQELRSACAKEEPAPDPARAFRRFATALEPRTPWRSILELARHGAAACLETPRWVRWAMAAQIVVVVAAAILVDAIPNESPALYHTLGSEIAQTGRMETFVVKFKPGADDTSVRRALKAASVRVVGAPTQSGLYVVEALTGASEDVLQALRADAAVELAERLSSPALP